MSRTGVLAVLTLVLAGCSANEPAADRGPTPASPTTSSSPTSSAMPVGGTFVDQIQDGPLEPGSYRLPLLGPANHPVVVVVDIPDGYSHWGPFVNAVEPPEPEDPLSISLWVVTGVYKNACKQTTLIPAGDSVRTLADAFVRQEVLSVTKPRHITLAGYDGLYLEIAAPTHKDYSHCKEAELTFWESKPTGSRWTRMPGMRDRLWILDVDGQPMMLAMFVPPSATDEQIDKITDILNDARFVRG
jgi:hypothetical protein